MKDYCCSDCLMLIANNQVPESTDTFSVPLWLEAINKRTAGFILTLGDDEIEFSRIGCDVCGSQLAGYRHQVHFLEK